LGGDELLRKETGQSHGVRDLNSTGRQQSVAAKFLKGSNPSSI